MCLLKNTVALVTGVSRKIGIGAGIVRELARGEASVFITYSFPNVFRSLTPTPSRTGIPDRIASIRDSPPGRGNGWVEKLC